MEQRTKKNPWLGLESYQEGEVLYGRDDDIRDLIQCVLNDVDTLLYGKSGIGKSSILNAGILPAARRNGYLPILIRLSHKEDENYLHQIKRAVINSMEISTGDKKELSKRIKEVVECKDEAKETIYEYFHRHTFHDKDGNRIKLLILFDQFEEIFTLQSDESKKRVFFAQMADFLNDIMPNELQKISDNHSEPQELVKVDNNNVDDLFDDIDFGLKSDLPEYVKDNDIHFVFTIREDFLSEFEYYTASIPSLKQNRYGLRPINEEQASQIILRPEPGLISPSVAKLIIEKVTGRTDFKLDGIPEIEVDSAVLSLYLNRLYEAKSSDVITSDLVEQKGGEIISDFYNEAISCISESSVVYLEDMLINGQGRRDNITVYDAIHEGKLTQNELDILCNKKKILRQFNYAGVLRIEYIHDILCPIITDRKEKREEENRIKQIEALAHKERLKSKKRLIWASSAFLILVICVAGYFLYNWYFYDYIKKSYYIAYELCNGWPVGVGPELSESEREQSPIYYELSHPGHAQSRYYSVRVCSSNAIIDKQEIIIPMMLTGIIPIDSISETMSDLQSRIRLVTFNPTADSEQSEHTLDYMAFFDGENNLLFTIKRAQEANQVKWFSFYNEKGQLMPINKNNIDRINVQTDSMGYISSALYFDNNGVKRPLWNNVYGYNQTVTLSDSSYYNVVEGFMVTTIDQFSQPTDNEYNTIRYDYGGDYIAISGFHCSDNLAEKLTEVAGPNGYSKVVRYRDRYDYYGVGSDAPIASMKLNRDIKGNITQALLDDPNSILASMPAKTLRTYDKQGRVLSVEMLDINGKPYSPNHKVYRYSYGYSENGDLYLREELADTGYVYYYKREMLADNIESVSLGGTLGRTSDAIPFHIRIDSMISENKTISYYYDRDRQPVNFNDGNNQPYHKVIYQKSDSIEEYCYYKINDKKMILPLDDKDSYFRLLRTLDKDGNMSTLQTFDSKNRILKSMMYFHNNGRLVGRAAMGIDLGPVRCDEWEEEGLLYYKLFFNRDFAGTYTDFMAVNEFSRPSLIRMGDDYINIKYANFNGFRLNLGNSSINALYDITVDKDYWQYYPQTADNMSNIKMTYIHLLDRNNILYLNGLRDGDVIYSCGTWKNGEDTSALKHQILDNNTITVLQPDNGVYRKKTVTLPRKLNMADLESVHFHNMNLSSSERINNKL